MTCLITHDKDPLYLGTAPVRLLPSCFLMTSIIMEENSWAPTFPSPSLSPHLIISSSWCWINHQPINYQLVVDLNCSIWSLQLYISCLVAVWLSDTRHYLTNRRKASFCWFWLISKGKERNNRNFPGLQLQSELNKNELFRSPKKFFKEILRLKN